MICLFLSNCTLWTKKNSQNDLPLPLEKKTLERYLSLVQKIPSHNLGFDPLEAKITQSPRESTTISTDLQTIQVYFLDLNHDGKKEYVALYFARGSLGTSGVLSVRTPQGKDLKFNQVVSKSLWKDSSGDISKFHLWLAEPPIVKKGDHYMIRFKDKNPEPTVTEYLWKNNKLKKINRLHLKGSE